MNLFYHLRPRPRRLQISRLHGVGDTESTFRKGE
jgi:hypothetical protein